MSRADDLIAACICPPEMQKRRVGLWEVCLQAVYPGALHADGRLIFPESEWRERRYFTALFRDTLATLHQPLGECVMEDSPRELRRHLPILLAARGRVLVSGLGLGCVVRGLLSKPEVEHIDVVEIDPSILELVGREFIGNPRVTVHYGDAETIKWPADARWDFAWHDVWEEDESLALTHMRMIARYRDLCDRQGAWQLPRLVKRKMPDWYIAGPRRRAA